MFTTVDLLALYLLLPSSSKHTLSYSLCVVWLQKWAFSPFHPVKRLWMATLLFLHIPLPPFTSYLTTVYSIRWGKPLWQQSNSNPFSQSSILSLHSIFYHHKIQKNTAVEILFFDNDFNSRQKKCHALIWNKLFLLWLIFPMTFFHLYSTNGLNHLKIYWAIFHFSAIPDDRTH